MNYLEEIYKEVMKNQRLLNEILHDLSMARLDKIMEDQNRIQRELKELRR